MKDLSRFQTFERIVNEELAFRGEPQIETLTAVRLWATTLRLAQSPVGVLRDKTSPQPRRDDDDHHVSHGRE